MFRKSSYLFILLLFLILIVIFLASGKLWGKKKFFGQNNIQGVATRLGESLIEDKSEGDMLESSISGLVISTPNPSGQVEVLGSVDRELVAKMTGDVGFDAVISPVDAVTGSREFKVLVVKELSDRRMQTLEIQTPIGWLFRLGGGIKNKEVIGRVKINVFIGDNIQEIPISILNDQEIDGHFAHWKFYFGSIESPSEVLDGFVDGDEKSGFRVSIARGYIHNYRPQTRFELNIFSKGDGGSAVFSGSGDVAGKVKAKIKFFDGSSVEIEN